MTSFETIFGKKKNIVIGAIHLPPLPGYPDFPGIDVAVRNAIADLEALIAGGVDGIIFENNYDLPHTISVSPDIVAAMTTVGKELRGRTTLPLGVSVLWNDYTAALNIAKGLGLQFIRVPVFVDEVQTSYGKVSGDATAVISYRKKISAEEVLLFTDIHVKHAELLTDEPITDTAKRAIEAGSDGLIITGKWTGNAPDLNELITVRKEVGDFPILCGSGVDEINAPKLFEYANGAIVSTSLKEEGDPHTTNVLPYESRIERSRVDSLVRSVKEDFAK